MRLDGRIEIAAPAPAVWALVLDPVALAGCIPGVRELHPTGERSFAGSITAAVGPMEGDFAFSSVIARDVFPDGLEVTLEGTDSVTKSRLVATVTAGVTEAAGADGGPLTTLAYHAEIGVKGRLAILGEMVLRATAGLMIGQVAACLRTRLEGGGADR